MGRGLVLVVVDCGMGNLHSVAKALEAAGAEVCVSGRPEVLEQAERIVFPGVGAFADGMANLEAAGLVEALSRQVRERRKPFLGICLGMQLLAREGYENGRHRGLGWLPGTVYPLEVREPALKVPHMGWNEVYLRADVPLFLGLGRSPVFYFAHSYHLVCDTQDPVVGVCEYGGVFNAAILQGNILATQFHPEKSQATGLRLLRNFLEWMPS